MVLLLTNVGLRFFISVALWKVSFAWEAATANQPLSRVGTGNFYDLVVSDGAFVDKSLLIDTYLRNKNVNIVVTRPRRFGKTINADMIKRFLEITVNAKGQTEREEMQRNYKLFVGGLIRTESGEMKMLQPLKISYSEFSMKQQGYWPVVFVQFGQIRGNNSEQIEDSLREHFSRLFEHYTYLVDKFGNDSDKQLFESYRRGNAPRERLEHCLEFLTTRIRTHWNRKVHLIIDDYDVPVVEHLSGFLGSKSSYSENSNLQLFQESVNSIEFKNSIKLVRDLLWNVLKNNSALEKSMILGTLPIDEIVGGNIGLKNLGRTFADFYGFSQSEIDNIFPGVFMKNYAADYAIQWYGGYRNMGKMTYNTYSIMRCLQKEGKIKIYLTTEVAAGQSGGDKFIEQLLLIDKVPVPMADVLFKPLVRTHLDHINVKISSDINRKTILHCLHLYGYLTAVKNYEHTDIDGELSSPNEEIRNIMRQSAVNWYMITFGVSMDHMDKLAKYLRENKTKEYIEAATEVFLKRFKVPKNFTKPFNSTFN